MLNIYLGEMDSAIYHPPVYFDNTYEDEWIIDSATGKTTLIDMIRQAFHLGISSGIEVVCDVPCRTLEGQFRQS